MTWMLHLCLTLLEKKSIWKELEMFLFISFLCKIYFSIFIFKNILMNLFILPMNQTNVSRIFYCCTFEILSPNSKASSLKSGHPCTLLNSERPHICLNIKNYQLNFIKIWNESLIFYNCGFWIIFSFLLSKHFEEQADIEREMRLRHMKY